MLAGEVFPVSSSTMQVTLSHDILFSVLLRDPL
jgi:hypothetical protein